MAASWRTQGATPRTAAGATKGNPLHETPARDVGMALMIRWSLVVPAAVVGWIMALLAGLGLLALADRFCPAASMVSGACTAPWHAPVTTAIFCTAAALAALLVILLPVLMAPAHRGVVAWIAFGGGMVFALYALTQTAAWLAFVCAAVSGTATLVAVLRRTRRSAAEGEDATRA
jgi:hypothetical protein